MNDRQNPSAEWGPSVSAVMLNNFLAYWKKAGCDMKPLHSMLADHADRLEDVHYRVSLALVADLFDQAADQLHDPVMGIKIGNSITPAQLGMLGSIIVSAPGAMTALKTLKRYSCLMTDIGTFHMAMKREKVFITFAPVSDVRISYHQIDGILATFIKQVRWILGAEQARNAPALPITLHLAHDHHGRQQEYAELLEAEVLFNQPENRIAFSARHYQWPPGLRDNRFHSYQLEMAEKKRRDLKQQVPFSVLVKRVLPKYFHRGEVSLENIAYELKISRRYLQQRLQEEKKTFRALRDEFRQEQALALLREDQATIEEIAEILGYSEVSAFYRAFRRWTGQAPRQYAADRFRQNGPSPSPTKNE